MKIIISPVDFSEESKNALSFAIELSQRSSARLIAIHVMQNNEEEEETKIKLKSIESGLEKFDCPNILFEILLVKGDFIIELKKVIEKFKPDIIVMGTKGASGLKKLLIGSNTVKVISKTKVPVLVIPDLARFKNFMNKKNNRIVFATDLKIMENDQPLEILKTIAMLTVDPKLSVLNVRPKHTVLYDLTKMERETLLSYFKPEVESERITIYNRNVIDGINLYLDKKTDICLIAMISHDSGDLIQKHYSREMALHTHLPLLVLHEVKLSSNVLFKNN